MYLERFFGAGRELLPCAQCQTGARLDFDIKMAFQPIVDAGDRSIFAYEALVRSTEGGAAAEVMGRLRHDQLYRFDQTCRVKAIETAMRLGLKEKLSINFFPNAVYEPATCIRLTLEAAQRFGLPADRLIFEAAETERVLDQAHLQKIYRDYQSRGFLTAIDDFGAGYAGLSMLTEFRPDILKIDMMLIRGIDQDSVRETIVSATLRIAEALGALVIAEGVETVGEYRTLRALGVSLFQGYLFGRPSLEALTPVEPAVWASLEEAR